jgi:NAD-dependent dihydropyrimidine dehydrogenase PreA subunit
MAEMSHRYKIGVREAWCGGCGLCVEFCPKGVFILGG